MSLPLNPFNNLKQPKLVPAKYPQPVGWVVGSVLMLTTLSACVTPAVQTESPVYTPEQVAQSNSATSDLVYDDRQLDYTLPKSVTDICYSRKNYACPELSVTYVNTSVDWINDNINAFINESIPDMQASDHAGASNRRNNLSQYAVKQRLDNFAQAQIDDIPINSSLSYSFSIEPTYLGHYKHVEMFGVNSYLYTGGAHGIGFSEYFMFDMAAKKPLHLQDILLPDQTMNFKALAHAEFKKWLKDSDIDPKAHEKDWPFTLTDNAVLNKEGIRLTYQFYEITPYVYGMPELTIPYAKLNGIIRPKYMP